MNKRSCKSVGNTRYNTFNKAIGACNSDTSCIGILNRECENRAGGLNLRICLDGIFIAQEGRQSVPDCLYKKAENKGTKVIYCLYLLCYIMQVVLIQIPTHAFNFLGPVRHNIIPLPNENGCPKGTIGCSNGRCPSTCYCEDHCSWERCVLEEATPSCLASVSSKWTWESDGMYWVAQFSGNMHTL